MALKLKQQAPASARRLTLLRPSKQAQPDLAERLWAAVYLPQLALDVLTTDPSAAVCCVQQRDKAMVYVANQAAQQLGIESGISASAARALAPNLAVLNRQQALEQQAAERLAQRLYRFSAWVHIAEPKLLLLELKGSLKLFAGLSPLLTALRAEIQRHYATVVIAVAPTPSMAILLARAGDETPLLQPQNSAGRLAKLPLQVLQTYRPDWFLRLQKLGLQHYGELLRLPRAGLQKRFGVELGDYLRRLLGETAECPAAWQPPVRYQSQQELAQEVSASDTLLPMLEQMLAALCQWLQQRAARIQRFEFTFYGYQQPVARFEIGFLRPANRLQAMQKLLALRLEREVLAAPVASIELRAEQLIYPQRLSLGQQSLWLDETSDDDSWWDSLETIQARLGADAVVGLACVDEHRPEWAWKTVFPGEKSALSSEPIVRPLWLYEQPRALSVSEQKQLCLQSRPERIASGWWDQDRVFRDYFVAQIGTQKLWVFRDAGASLTQWYCHGLFD